jgi:hypothetical protein
MTAEPLAKPAAKALDRRVRSASDSAATQLRTLLDLLEQAATGQIDAALGCASLTMWIHDAAQIAPADAARERRWPRWCLTND